MDYWSLKSNKLCIVVISFTFGRKYIIPTVKPVLKQPLKKKTENWVPIPIIA